MFRNHRQISVIVAVVVAAAIGGGAYAFTASNTVPTTTAGSGAAAIRAHGGVGCSALSRRGLRRAAASDGRMVW